MKNLITRITRWVNCNFNDDHVWTTDALENRKPRIPITDFENSYQEHIKPRCKYCPCVKELTTT